MCRFIGCSLYISHCILYVLCVSVYVCALSFLCFSDCVYVFIYALCLYMVVFVCVNVCVYV